MDHVMSNITTHCGTRVRRRTTRQCGFMFIDAVIGLAIVGMLIVMLGVALNRQARAMARFADERGATWAAEAALAQMQNGHALTTKEIKVDPTEGADAAPAGYVWVNVRATHGDRSAALIGLVPRAALAAPSPAAGEKP
jgi:type II secretory pathway pseudopilin PulG